MIKKNIKDNKEDKLVKIKCDHCARKLLVSEKNVRTPYYCC